MITAEVKHSQRLSVPPVKTLVAAEKGGAVVCAHCDFMAGLGEACSTYQQFFSHLMPMYRQGSLCYAHQCIVCGYLRTLEMFHLQT